MANIEQTAQLTLAKSKYENYLDWNLGGVYSIVNVDNGKIYFGKTKSFRKRLTSHRYLLKLNKHFNGHLQNEYNKKTVNSFRFNRIMVSSNEQERSKIETKLIKSYLCDPERANQCYNMLTEGYEHKCAEKIARKLAKTFSIKSPQGHVYNVVNINKFCREHDLTASAVSLLLNGKVDQHKGWIRSTDNKDEIEKRRASRKNANAKTCFLVDPSGKKIQFTNLHSFVKENNLNRSMLSLLVNGKIDQYRKWTRVGEEREKIFSNLQKRCSKRGFRKKKYSFISPDNKKIFVVNLQKFCQENNLSYYSMSKVANKKRCAHKGWTING